MSVSHMFYVRPSRPRQYSTTVDAAGQLPSGRPRISRLRTTVSHNRRKSPGLDEYMEYDNLRETGFIKLVKDDSTVNSGKLPRL